MARALSLSFSLIRSLCQLIFDSIQPKETGLLCIVHHRAESFVAQMLLNHKTQCFECRAMRETKHETFSFMMMWNRI